MRFVSSAHYQSEVGLDQILSTTETALSLDDHLAEAHASRGLALSLGERFDEAKAAFERAIALDGNLYEAHYFYARSSFVQGNLERAAALFERAREIKPNDYQSTCLLGPIYHSLGREEESIAVSRKGVELAEQELAIHPEDSRPAQLVISTLVNLGETGRARELIARVLAFEPDVACGYAKMGDIDDAITLLERGLARRGKEYGILDST